MNPLKTKWLPQPFKKRWLHKKIVGMITYESLHTPSHVWPEFNKLLSIVYCLLDCIQNWYGCSLGISDDLINCWDEFIKNKIAAAVI